MKQEITDPGNPFGVRAGVILEIHCRSSMFAAKYYAQRDMLNSFFPNPVFSFPTPLFEHWKSFHYILFICFTNNDLHISDQQQVSFYSVNLVEVNKVRAVYLDE